MEEQKQGKVEISRRGIFKIFLKTGTKRILLSIFAGVIIFSLITSLCMVLYKHHYTDLLEKEAEIEWFNDNKVSAMAYHPTGITGITTGFFDRFTSDFKTGLESLIPDLEVGNFTVATSMQMFRYMPWEFEPWSIYELMAPDDIYYSKLNDYIVMGRLPQNESELLYVAGGVDYFWAGDRIEFYEQMRLDVPVNNYTVVGLLDPIFYKKLYNDHMLSRDVYNWRENDYTFFNYAARGVFLTNFTNYQKIITSMSSYYGKMLYLLDAEYDFSRVNMNKFREYARSFEGSYIEDYIPSLYVSANLGPDLKIFMVNYSNEWIAEFTRIIGINTPLLFILGLFCVVTLTIGSKDLNLVFQRMKLYGLSYRAIRSLIILENTIFTIVSLIGGTLIGFFISYLVARNVDSMLRPFYSNFIVDPLFLLSMGIFFVVFFVLSIYIQNSIAKKATRDVGEEYKKKRRRIRALFSSSEFILLNISLVFVIISIVLFVGHNQYGSQVPLLNTFSFQTLFWFFIACSIALGITFVFLLLARLLIYLWSFISRWTWEDKLNPITLSIKHITDNRKIYQLTILASFIFALVILPSISSETSIPKHIQFDTKLSMGNADLVIEYWNDPENELDYIFENIPGIANFTEITAYWMSNGNEQLRYDKPYQITSLAIHDPSTFVEVVDISILENSVEDILSLSSNYNALVDYKYTRANKLEKVINITTEKFTNHHDPITFTYVDSFDYFPLTYLIKRNIFKNIERLSIVTSYDTMSDFIGKLDFFTNIYSENMKLIKATNESMIPYIQAELDSMDFNAKTVEEYHSEMFFEVDPFLKSNLYFFAFLGIITLIFIGYFTGRRIFEERLRTTETLYRIGAKRRQILGMYTLELTFVNIIPIIVMLFASFPVIRFVSVYYLGVSETYTLFQNYTPAWLLTAIIFGGLILIILGWLIALIPKIYQYKPIKQE
jgi:hypothetical protein